MKNFKCKNVKLDVDEVRKIKGGGLDRPRPACYLNYEMPPVMDCNQCAYYKSPCFPYY